jgi:hypothetical protein
MTVVLGGAIWLLTTKAWPFPMPTLDSTAWLAWMKQAQSYPAPPPEPPKPAAPVTDPNAALLAKLALLQAQLEEQRHAIEALKKRPYGTTVVQLQQGQAAKVTPRRKPMPRCSLWRMRCRTLPRSPPPPSIPWRRGPPSCPVSSKQRLIATSRGTLRPRSRPMSMTPRRGGTCSCPRARRSWAMIRAVPCSTAMSSCRRSV